MTTLAALKKNRSKSAAQLAEAASKLNAKSYEVDTRYWKPTRDKAGNGLATIRFLPAIPGEDTPWVMFFDHFFKGPTGRYYVEKSLTTMNQNDPAAEANSKIWNAGETGVKKIRDEGRKRRQNFVSNILVVNDPAHPENNGKVFLFQYGKKIFDKLMEKFAPTFEGEEAHNIFDFWDGANFKLKIRGTDNGPNYDSSSFDAATPVADNDDAIDVVWKSQYSLQAEIAPDKFKSYDELVKVLAAVIGDTDEKFLQEVSGTAPTPARQAAPARQPVVADEEEDDLSFFNKIAS